MNAQQSYMKTQTRHAFTRLELLIVLVAIGLLGTVSMSLLGSTQSRSERIVCQNNLRQIGRAFHIWASDHQNRNPWFVPWYQGGVLTSTGEATPPPPATWNVPGIGVFPEPERHNAWFLYLWVYQEMPSPSILVCPGDKAKEVALTFSRDPNAGFASNRYKNSALSYDVGLHALPEFPASILAADRHMTLSPGAVGCVTGIQNSRYLAISPGTVASSWSTLLHLGVGNMLQNDGRVEEFSSEELNSFLQATRINVEGNGVHILSP
jgi:competence protein ComGC